MTEAELQLLKSSIDKGEQVQIVTVTGETLVAKVISVFDEESDADMFYQLVSTSHPNLYPRMEKVGGYSLPLMDIVSVYPVV